MFIAMEISSDNVRWGPFPFSEFSDYLCGMISSNRSSSHYSSLVQLKQEVDNQMNHVSKYVLANTST